LNKKTAKANALRALSNYIRERDGWVCFTCGKGGDKHTMDCGHLISRYWSATLFDEKNCNCQCKGCNIAHENDYEIYKKAWVDKYGERAYDELYAKSKTVVRRTQSDYLDLEKYFKRKLEEL